MQRKSKRLDSSYITSLAVRCEIGIIACQKGSVHNNDAHNVLVCYNTAHSLHALGGYNHQEILDRAKTAIGKMLAHAKEHQVYLLEGDDMLECLELCIALMEQTTEGKMSEAIKLQNTSIKKKHSAYYGIQKLGKAN
jgi:hypothetical protein